MTVNDDKNLAWHKGYELIFTEPEFVDFKEKDTRDKITRMVLNLFGRWQVDENTQACLLGCKQRTLRKYKVGKAMPNYSGFRTRAVYLLAIHCALRILYPNDREFLYSWVLRYNQALGSKPLELMYNTEGLRKIVTYLRGVVTH